MNIILEGLWFSPKERFVEALAKQKPEWVSHIAPCPTITPTVDFKAWMTTLTKSSKQWRSRASSEEVVIFENSPFSLPAYTEVFCQDNGLSGDEEHGLLVSIIEGLSETLSKPDAVLLFLCKPLDTPERYAGLHKEMNLHTIEELQASLVRWAEQMRDNGIQVLAVMPPKRDQTWESWANGTLHVLKQIVGNQ